MKNFLICKLAIIFITLNSFKSDKSILVEHLCRYRIRNSSGQVIGTIQFNAPDNVSCDSPKAKAVALAMFDVYGSNW